MHWKCLLLLALWSIGLIVSEEETTWLSLTEANAESQKTGKMIMFLMTKSDEWCKPCKKLAKSLSTSEEFKELSNNFVLARAKDAEVPKDEKYNFDATYVPKILFMDQHGNIYKKIVNAQAKENAKYFYKSALQVIDSMHDAMKPEHKLDAGWGTKYDWKEPENAFEIAKETQRPIMMILHQDWCSACQKLKPIIASSEEMETYKDVFVMVNTDSDTYVKGEKYKLDGEYYPKIVFLDSNGFVFEDEVNEGTEHKHVMHYYANGKEVAESMLRVLHKLVDREKQADDNGFGNQIKWVNYTDAQAIATEQRKPIMIIFHASFCGACKRLKQKLSESWEFVSMSHKFVMVNVGEHEQVNVPEYFPDGGYIPRIIFTDNNADIEASITNEEDEYEKNVFAYGSADSLLKSMRRAIQMQLGHREPKKNKRFSQGLGTDIAWMKYEEGLNAMKKLQKPMFVIFHNDYCLFSATMKQQIRESKELYGLSQKFVMVEANETEAENIGSKFYIDGDYTPRIMFMDTTEEVRPELNNSFVGNYPTTLFYYDRTEEIIDIMKMAMEQLKPSLGNGFGDYIDWKTLRGGMELAKELNRPMMVIVHKPGCPACENLKPKMKYDRTIWELTNNFIMVNVEDDDMTVDDRNLLQVDGAYFPRVHFLTPEGEIAKEVHNLDPKFLKYKYSYNTEEQVQRAMKNALKHFGLKGNPLEGEVYEDGRQLLKETGLQWFSLYGALREAKTKKQMVMFLIGRKECPSCKAFLKTLGPNEEFIKEAKNFILAEAEDDVDRATADLYNVDGAYAPRVFFLDPEGEIMTDVWNKETAYVEHKYYHYDSKLLVNSMKEAQELFKTWTPKPKVEEQEKKDKEDKKEVKEDKKTSKKKDDKKKKNKSKKAKKEKKEEL